MGNAVPWPRFRGNAEQTGRLPVSEAATRAWTWPPTRPTDEPGNAARGFFNSVVIDGLGNILSGDASGRLLHLSAQGERLSEHPADGLIDTTPLLVDPQTAYFSCGDGWIWRTSPVGSRPTKFFQAAQPTDAFINWFEGHLALDAHGRIVAPCDNRRVYVVDPAHPQRFWDFAMQDQTWSLPCLNRDGQLFFGNNAMRVPGAAAPSYNLFGVDSNYRTFWQYETGGSVVASPMWGAGDWLYAGSFDGTLYAFDFSGEVPPQTPAWTFQTRDHLYASPAQLSNGHVIQAGCDGSVYALHPFTGELLWQYDTVPLNPLRSSPAIDAQDRIWLGTGDGCVLVLDEKRPGRLSRRQPLDVPGPRKAINGSPALSEAGVVLGDSEGALHLVAWQAPPAEARVEGGDGSATLGKWARLLTTDVWGVNRAEPPTQIRLGETLCFTLDARTDIGAGTWTAILGLLQSVEVFPREAWLAELSGDRRYVLVRPRIALQSGTEVELTLRTDWAVDPQRQGLRMGPGHRAGQFDTRIKMTVAPAQAGAFEPPSTLWFQRIVMSLPTLMPSYNQIGFETLVYCFGQVAPIEPGRSWLYWLIGCKPDATPDTATHVRFPLVGNYNPATGLLELVADGVDSELNGFRTRVLRFTLSCSVLPDGRVEEVPCFRMSYSPQDVAFYGGFLENLGMGGEGRPIEVLGSGDLRIANRLPIPPNVTAQATVRDGKVTVTSTAGKNVLENVCLSIVLQGPDKLPVKADYAWSLSQRWTQEGVELVLPRPAGVVWPEKMTVWLMVNSTPVLATQAAS